MTTRRRLKTLTDELMEAVFRAAVWRREQTGKSNVTAVTLRRDLTYENILAAEKEAGKSRKGKKN